MLVSTPMITDTSSEEAITVSRALAAKIAFHRHISTSRASAAPLAVREEGNLREIDGYMNRILEES